MAKIVETVFVVKLSQLVRDNPVDVESVGFDDLPKTIEEVVQQLVASDVLVEVERAEWHRLQFNFFSRKLVSMDLII